MTTGERWPARDRIAISAGVFLLALLVRLLHIWSIRDAPYFALRMGDAADHHDLALAFASGDWLGGGEDVSGDRTRQVLFHAPLYPYFLGVIYSMIGTGAMAVRVIQATLGALSCVFVAQATGRLFTRREALVGGALLALYGPAIFYDTTFQDSVLDLFFASLALWAIVEAVLTRRLSLLFAAGLAIGGLNLTRENGIILLVPLLAWVAFQRAVPGRRRLAGALVVVAGVATAIAPVAARSLALSGRLLPGDDLRFSLNLYLGNNPDADGYYRPLREGRGNPRYEMQDAIDVAEQQEGRPLTLAEVSDHWLDRTLDYITGQPGDWLALMARKTALAAQTVEAADVEDLYTYAERSPILALTGRLLGFGTLLALAVLGVFVTWPERRRLLLFHALPVIYIGTVIAFLVFGRYRHPVAPYLVVFAAPALTGLATALRERRRVALAGVAAALGVLVFAHLPIGFTTADLRAHTHANVGAALEQRGDVEGAAREYLEALAIQPEAAQPNQFLGDLLRRSGAPDRALPYLDRAMASDPGNGRLRNDYGAALAALGRTAEARDQFRQALALDPLLPQPRLNLGAIALREQGPEAALPHFRQAVTAAPGDAAARRLLTATLLRADSLSAGLAHADTLTRLASAEEGAIVVLATVWEMVTGDGARAGAPAQALGILEAAPAWIPRDARFHRVLAAAQAAGGRFQAAARTAERALELLGPGDRPGDPTAAELRAELERYRRGGPPG